ncbi:MAG: cytochrome c3 family protein [Pseudomonadota bacterium]
MIRYVIVAVAGVIIVVLLPLALRYVQPHGIETIGPPTVTPPAEAKPWALSVDRGPGTAGAMTPDPAELAPRTLVFDRGNLTKPAVQFDHFAHASVNQLDIACTDCHHKSTGTQVSMGCAMCHRDAHSGAMFSLKAAQHKSCIGCHLEANAAKPDGAAPTACEGCHHPAR